MRHRLAKASGREIAGHGAATTAFTLLELLVATVITLAIAGIMLAVVTGLLDVWRRSLDTQTQTMAARQVFDLIERDLQSALHRRDARCWLAADILDTPGMLANHGWLVGPGSMKPGQGGSLRPLPESGADGVSRIQYARFGLSGVWLRLVTTNPESTGGLPTVVSWQMVRRPVTGDPVPGNPAPVRYSLYRSAVSSSEAFEGGYDVTDSAYGSTSNTPSSALSTAYRQRRNVTNPSHANVLASNVVDFGCWFYVREPSGNPVRIYPAAPGDGSHHAIGNSEAHDSRFPHFVDVLVRVLTGEGALMLDSMENGRLTRPSYHETDAAWWWDVVESNSDVFVRRFEIKGGSF